MAKRLDATDRQAGVTVSPPVASLEELRRELEFTFVPTDEAAPLPAQVVRESESGTKYVSGGLTAGPDVYAEEGSSRYVKLPDRVPQFVSRIQAARIYDQMVVNDATVDVSLRVAKTPILGAYFYMQPYDDDQKNLDIAEFVDANIFGGTVQPFLLILEEILRCFDYGFTLLEPVWELREWSPKRAMANRKKYTMLKKLGARHAPTIADIKYDDHGDIVSVLHNAVRADNSAEKVKIPYSKLIPFSHNKTGGGLDNARSLLRTAYKHWYYKDQLYKIDGIQKERHAIGVPTAKLAPGYTEADVTTAWKMVTNLRTNENSGAVLPPNIELAFAKVEGHLVDVIASIEHHEARIMLNVMAEFMLLGLQGAGGRSTAGAQVDIFQKAYKYIANQICDSFNLYLVPLIVGYNYDTDEYPKMKVRNIGEGKDIQMWAAAFANLVSEGIITPDFDLEQWAREQMDAPLKSGTVQTPLETAAPDDSNDNGNGNGNGKGSVPSRIRTGNIGKPNGAAE